MVQIHSSQVEIPLEVQVARTTMEIRRMGSAQPTMKVEKAVEETRMASRETRGWTTPNRGMIFQKIGNI